VYMLERLLYYRAMAKKTTPEEARNIAVFLAGGPKRVGEICGVRSQAVSQWLVIPPRRALKLSKAIKNQVTVQQMCPEVFGT
jgi:DNA-binding transcriptional regulator YdaS (Cro superfamily)